MKKENETAIDRLADEELEAVSGGLQESYIVYCYQCGGRIKTCRNAEEALLAANDHESQNRGHTTRTSIVMN